MSVWFILGCGPTLERAAGFKPDQTVAVNRAANIFDQAKYVAAIDPVTEKDHRYILDAVVGKTRIVTDFTIEVSKARDLPLQGNIEVVENSSGSALAALKFCARMGAKTVICYGVGGSGYAKPLKGAWDTRSKQKQERDCAAYRNILDEMIIYAEENGITLELR